VLVVFPTEPCSVDRYLEYLNLNGVTYGLKDQGVRSGALSTLSEHVVNIPGSAPLMTTGPVTALNVCHPISSALSPFDARRYAVSSVWNVIRHGASTVRAGNPFESMP
jgi:hypothetical protein